MFPASLGSGDPVSRPILSLIVKQGFANCITNNGKITNTKQTSLIQKPAASQLTFLSLINYTMITVKVDKNKPLSMLSRIVLALTSLKVRRNSCLRLDLSIYVNIKPIHAMGQSTVHEIRNCNSSSSISHQSTCAPYLQ